MENQTLTKPPIRPSTGFPQTSKSQLISEWIAKLALNAGEALTAKTQSVYLALWGEGFDDLPYAVLEAAFKKAIRTCKFWPVKVADIREHVDRTRETAVGQAAETEWERVLEYRRLYWNPDMPGGFDRDMPKLSEQVGRAARASGIFKMIDCEQPAERLAPDALHVWAKKRFIESYVAWEQLEQDRFLLPDGEIKNLLAGAAEQKALPSTNVSFEELHERGLEYAKKLPAPAPPTSQQERIEATQASKPAPRLYTSPSVDEREARIALLKQQAELMKAKYAPQEAMETA